MFDFFNCFKGKNLSTKWGCKVTCYDLEVFGALSLEKLLQAVYDDACAYCREHRLQLHMIALTQDLLGIKRASSYPSAILSYIACKFGV